MQKMTPVEAKPQVSKVVLERVIAPVEPKKVDVFKPKTNTATEKKGIDAALDGLE